jgi:transcriptional regulator with XRE-family HTH domain
VEIGARLKAVREMRGLSQRELAKRAGVTNSTISLIEQNRVSPSVGSLRKVLDGLPMTLADFFTFDFESSEGHFYKSDELVDVSSVGASMLLVAANKRDRAMSIMHEFYPPGADTGPDVITHRGEEGGVVIRGSIEITIGSETRTLGPGEAYYFETHLPHRFRNQGKETCEIVSACTPPSF